MGSIARATHHQHQTFVRGQVLYNSPAAATGIIIGHIPMGALLSSIDVTVMTAQNAGTTNTVSIGLIPETNGILSTPPAAQSNLVAAAPAGAVAFTKNAPTAANVYCATDMAVVMSLAQSGTAATAGAVTAVVTYTPNL